MFVGFSISLSTETILAALRELLPTLSVGLYEEVIANDVNDFPDVAFSVLPNESNFPLWVDFAWFLKGAPTPDIFIELARQLSLKFDCQTVCEPGSYRPTDSPYWVIVWDKGEAFLGDDVNMDIYDGGVINIFQPLTVPVADLQGLIDAHKNQVQNT